MASELNGRITHQQQTHTSHATPQRQQQRASGHTAQAGLFAAAMPHNDEVELITQNRLGKPTNANSTPTPNPTKHTVTPLTTMVGKISKTVIRADLAIVEDLVNYMVNGRSAKPNALLLKTEIRALGGGIISRNFSSKMNTDIHQFLAAMADKYIKDPSERTPANRLTFITQMITNNHYSVQSLIGADERRDTQTTNNKFLSMVDQALLTNPLSDDDGDDWVMVDSEPINTSTASSTHSPTNSDNSDNSNIELTTQKRLPPDTVSQAVAAPITASLHIHKL